MKMRLALLELLVKIYVRKETLRPPSVVAVTDDMLAKSRSNDPVSKLDLDPYFDYTSIQEDHVIYNNILTLLKSKGIKHIDNKLISANLLVMGNFIVKQKKRVPSRVDMHSYYFGVKLRTMIAPHNSSYVPERYYGSFFNREAAKRHRDPSRDEYSV